MNFLSISKDAQGVIVLWLFFVQMLYVFNFFCHLQFGKHKSKVRCILLCVISFVLLQILIQQMKGDMLCPVTLSLWALLTVIFLLMIFALAEQYRINRWRRSHVSANSVKEALDALPTGLCFALPGGLPLLVNEKMEEIEQALFGGFMQDAKKVWDALEGGRAEGLIKNGPEPIYELPGGRVYGFRKEELELSVGTVHVIFATDLTEEYALTRELEEKRKKAGIINARLKVLMETIEYVTMSRELLQLKMALHDNLGRSLLSAKRYVLNPKNMNLKEILSIWKQNLSHLIGEVPEEWQIPGYLARKEASTLGIDLQIVGTIPEDDRLLPVIDQAISTHVINVLRHADGHVAMVRILEEESHYKVCFSNDGNPPAGEISLTGGLGNVKRQVEALGGKMEVTAAPGFEMKITLPKYAS